MDDLQGGHWVWFALSFTHSIKLLVFSLTQAHQSGHIKRGRAWSGHFLCRPCNALVVISVTDSGVLCCSFIYLLIHWFVSYGRTGMTGQRGDYDDRRGQPVLSLAAWPSPVRWGGQTLRFWLDVVVLVPSHCEPGSIPKGSSGAQLLNCHPFWWLWHVTRPVPSVFLSRCPGCVGCPAVSHWESAASGFVWVKGITSVFIRTPVGHAIRSSVVSVSKRGMIRRKPKNSLEGRVVSWEENTAVWTSTGGRRLLTARSRLLTARGQPVTWSLLFFLSLSVCLSLFLCHQSLPRPARKDAIKNWYLINRYFQISPVSLLHEIKFILTDRNWSFDRSTFLAPLINDIFSQDEAFCSCLFFSLLKQVNRSKHQLSVT